MSTSRIAFSILLAFLVIFLRVWHLGVIQREERLVAAEKPQRRTLYLRPNRGTISDRFGIPMAVNKISHRATFYYNQLSSIPQVRWEEKGGKKIKTFPRKAYIQKFSRLCGEILGLDAERTEDLIHSKAALFPHIPFCLKESISEKEYFTLKALENQWPGLCAEISSQRHYPLGKTGCHLLGTIGKINREEYSKIVEEAKRLEEELLLAENGLDRPFMVGFTSLQKMALRLEELKEKAYSLTDWVGKLGIEKQYEEKLRGFFGKEILEVDQKGRVLKTLPWSQEAIPGEHITLSISAELQQFAEQLLEEHEHVRRKKDGTSKQRPWVRGGAIAALDPKTGEILALASIPRFDPNDFVQTSPRVSQWLESASYLGAIWDGLETFPPASDQILSWEGFLERVSYPSSPVHQFFQTVNTVKRCVSFQEDFEAVLYHTHLAPEEMLSRFYTEEKKALLDFPLTKPLWKRLEPLFSLLPNPKTALFVLDLSRLVLDSSRFTDPLLKEIGSLPLSTYRSLTQAVCKLEKAALQEAKEAFHKGPFAAWKKSSQTEFLEQIRLKEKIAKRHPKPYLDLLDAEEARQFSSYWERERLSLLSSQLSSSPEIVNALKGLLKLSSYEEFLHTCRSFQMLERPLFGSYRRLRGSPGKQTEKDLALGFYPVHGFGYLRSAAFQEASPLGSLFKLISGYEGLRQGFSSFSLIDSPGWDQKGKQILAYSLQNTPYPRIYKGGRLPKSSSSHIGQVDLKGALEQSSNPFFALLAGDLLKHPTDLEKAARLFGFGERSGVDLPGEAGGMLPNDLEKNRTGLYSFSIGQHTLLSTPLQAAIFLATLGNKGLLLKPWMIKSLSGTSKNQHTLDVFSRKNTFAQKELDAIGIPFSLFTEKESRGKKEETKTAFRSIRRTLPMSASLRNPLLEGMDRVMWGTRGNARPGIIQELLENPAKLHEHLALKNQVVGKTSTAQITYRSSPDPSSPVEMVTHVWFGALSFDAAPLFSSRWESPELVVIAFLRFGSSGKEAAPLATQLIRKWREINQRGQADKTVSK